MLLRSSIGSLGLWQCFGYLVVSSLVNSHSRSATALQLLVTGSDSMLEAPHTVLRFRIGTSGSKGQESPVDPR